MSRDLGPEPASEPILPGLDYIDRELGALKSAALPAFEAAVGHTTTQNGPRIDNLVLQRESTATGHDLLEGLAYQAAGFWPEIPGIAAVAAAGAAPLRSRDKEFTLHDVDDAGEPIDVAVHVETYRRGAATMYVFAYKTTYYAYCLTSAAKSDETGLNDFTILLINLLARLRPRNLRTVTFSRYVRSQKQGGLLLHGCDSYVDVVWAGQLALYMNGPLAPTHQAIFAIMAMVSAMERDWIVARLLAGKVHKWHSGQWLYGPKIVPPGYYCDTREVLRVDDSKLSIKRVGALIDAVARRYGPTQFKKALATAGFTARPKIGTDGSVIYRDLTASAGLSKLRWAWAWMPLLATGEHVVRLSNPFPGATQVSGEPVHYTDASEAEIRSGRAAGHLLLWYRPGRPTGGWADQAIEDEALRIAQEQSQRSGGMDALQSKLLPGEIAEESINSDAHNGVLTHSQFNYVQATQRSDGLPLSGLTWSDSLWHYQLATERSDLYQLVRWPDAVSVAILADVLRGMR